MPFDPNDPRLTAYALGELDDAERVEFESSIAESDEARRFIEETRATARLLAEHLGREGSPGLSPEQRQSIEKRLHAQAQSPLQAPAAPALADARPGGPVRGRRRHLGLRGRAGRACLPGGPETSAGAGPGHEAAGPGTHGGDDTD